MIKYNNDVKKVPILLILFNRSNFSKEIISLINQIQPQELYISFDGPRNDEDLKAIEQSIDYMNQLEWVHKPIIRRCDKNYGIALGPKLAIDWFFCNVPAGIILEDDCRPDFSFFKFSMELLEKYQNNENIKIISGNNYTSDFMPITESYYFSNYANIWGWASWKRVWSEYKFELDDLAFFTESKRIYEITFSDKEANYWLRHFSNLTSWDFQLSYLLFNKNGLSIVPKENLVQNIGFSHQSSHVFLNDSIRERGTKQLTFPLSHPDSISVNKVLDEIEFKQTRSKCIGRTLRVLKENSIKSIMGYILRNFLKIKIA